MTDEQDEGKIIQEKEEEENQEEKQQDEEELEEGSNEEVHQTPLKTPSRRVQKNHPPEQIIGDRSTRVETRKRKQVHTPEQGYMSLLSMVEPKDVEEAKRDKCWIKSMEE